MIVTKRYLYEKLEEEKEWRRENDRTLQERIMRLEQRVDLLIEYLGVTEVNPPRKFIKKGGPEKE